MKNRRNFLILILIIIVSLEGCKKSIPLAKVTIGMVGGIPKGVSGTGMWSGKIIPEE
ncbi:hypothetical protein KAW96_03930 [candidate division WOR-3 bacterium]|nr:hypothetical protein [candidate division WOR-3 bacterium]